MTTGVLAPGAGRLLALLQLLLGFASLVGAQITYRVPDPFSKLTESAANDFYYIKAEQVARKHEEQVEEYFSLGLGLTYSIHREKANKSAPWALLVDGRAARSYVLRNLEAPEAELDCELDHVHSHKQLFPWQYVYDVRSVAGGQANGTSGADVGLLPELDESASRQRKRRRSQRRRLRSSIYGVGAVWLNLVKADVRSELVGDNSPYMRADVWKLKSAEFEVEMVFAQPYGRLPADSRAAQELLDQKATPSQLKVRTNVPYKDTSVSSQFESLQVRGFAAGLKEEGEEKLQMLRLQLERCKKANRMHRQFPSLMRALASSSERLYKIEYVSHKFNLYGYGELDGKFSEQHHRFMWPYELTTEVLDLAHEVQTIIYDPSFMKAQVLSANGERMDFFMSRYTENAAGRSARHATAYYHMMVYDEETGLSCKVGEREPRPKYRLLSSTFTFQNAYGTEYPGHVHGLGALLLNAAHMHYKSFGLFTLEVEVPKSADALDDRRPVLTDVWQVFDKRDQVRALFFFERRDPGREPLSWDLADRDRNDLRRLVRVDLREARSGDESSLALDLESVQRDDDLLAQFFVFELTFELDEQEAQVFFSLPRECTELANNNKTPPAEDGDSSDEDEDPLDDTADSHAAKELAEPHADDSDEEDEPAQAADEFEILTGLEEHGDELPEFVEMLADQTSYKFVTRLELLDADAEPDGKAATGEARRSIWLVELMDLASEKLLLKVYLTRDSLQRDAPELQYFIFYESELVFRLGADKRCLRLNDVDTEWLRLFSGHLVYYLAMPSRGHKLDEQRPAHNDLVVTSNRLSSYGLGAFWRRASESGLAEFLGVRRARLTRGGRTYKQLVWAYEEFDMTILLTFLQEEGPNTRSRAAVKPRLESVLITNQYGNEFLSNFAQVRAVVEALEVGAAAQVLVPYECRDQVIEAHRMIEHDRPIFPPSLEDVMGVSEAYELEYVVASFRGDRQLQQTRVRESLDAKRNRAKIVIDADDPSKMLEIFSDGQSGRLLAMSHLLNKCAVLTELAPTYNSLLSTLVFSDQERDSDAMHGLMGLWQALAKREAKLTVRQMADFSGDTREEQIFRFEVAAPRAAELEPRREQIQIHFTKTRPTDYGGAHFNHDDKMRVRQPHELRLDWIEFRPLRGRAKLHPDGSAADRSSINLVSQLDHLSEQWELPQACKDLVAGEQGNANEPSTVQPGGEEEPGPPPPVVGGEFPKLSGLFQRTSRFRMRGEVTVRGPAASRVYLVEELYNGGDLRVRTHGLAREPERNCDLLMFLDSLNQFDLSRPLSCKRLFEDRASKCLYASLFDVWMQSVARVESLAELHYGPMSLWRLAERNAAHAKLIKSISMLPRGGAKPDESLSAYRAHLEREMNREVWLVDAKGAGQPGDWSYTMEFVKHQSPIVSAEGVQTGVNEWHVLESVTVSEGGGAQPVFVDVVNYNYQPDKEEFAQLFLLPEGWNCRRALADPAKDRPVELELDLNRSVRLSYEASLELLDGGPVQTVYEEDPELGPLRVRTREIAAPAASLPTLVGALLTNNDLDGFDVPAGASPEPGKREPRFHLSVDQSVARFPDGRAAARRLVTDRQLPLEYNMDTMSGGCAIRPVQSAGWRLDFPAADGKQLHSVPLCSWAESDQLSERDLFWQLFLDGEGHSEFFLVNKYEADTEQGRVLHTSFEREFDHLRLTNNLTGPGRVVRRFEQHTAHVRSDETPPSRAAYMTAQAYLLSEDKTRLRAILTVRLQAHPPAGLSEFLAAASVADCFGEPEQATHRRTASFTLEYPMLNHFDAAMGRSMEPLLRESFYANLLRSKIAGRQLLPLQLDGRARLDFSQRDRLARVHFDVLEAPSAMVHFSRRFQCAMNERMEAVAESRILPSAAACSRWCDQINCVAMSYCEDRQCRAATRAAVFGGARKDAHKSELERAADLVSLAACAAHEACTYYYNKAGTRPPTLDTLGDHLDRTVNLKINPARLKALSLPLDVKVEGFMRVHDRVAPTRFWSSSEAFRLQRDDSDDPFQLAVGDDDLFRSAGNQSVAMSHLQLAAGSFALWRPASQFDVNRIDALNEELGASHDSKFIMMWAVASGEASCLQECQRNQCLLVVSCRQQNRCQMIVPTGTKSILELGRLKHELVVTNADACTISIRDHLDKFHLFEATHRPRKFWRQLDGYTAQECAAACHLNAAECLAFDMCTYQARAGAAGEPADTVCFLQRDHVTQNSFDRQVLLPAWEQSGELADAEQAAAPPSRPADCDHYSRSVVAEFARLPNTKLKELHESALKGVSVDQCAADCLQDDACRAFEHCQNPRRTPTQSCYLVRDGPGTAAHTDWLDMFAANRSVTPEMRAHLLMSRTCSVYVARTALMRARVQQTLAPAWPELGAPGVRAATMLAYLLLATAVGAAVQFAHIRTTGRALSIR